MAAILYKVGPQDRHLQSQPGPHRETRVDLLHLLEDLRDAYAWSAEETVVTEAVANALNSGATVIQLRADVTAGTLTVLDNGTGMHRGELARYHDLAASTRDSTSAGDRMTKGSRRVSGS